MGKHNSISGILVLAVILMIAISTILVGAYATGLLTSAVAFISSDQVAKVQACGVYPPAEFYKLKADIPSLLVPGIYAGFPILMILIAMLMFIAGYYYRSGKEGSSSSETTTTISSPNRSKVSGEYMSGRHVEKTQTQRSSTSEEG